MSAHTRSPSIRHIQTLSHPFVVSSFDVRLYSHKQFKSVVLITGGVQGSISLFSSPLSHLHFTLQKRFRAHARQICGLHLHHHKPLFISHDRYANELKVWSFNAITSPCVIHSLPHPSEVSCANYSESGLLLTGCRNSLLLTDCRNGLLRVYGKEPLFSLLWSCQTSGYICSLVGSPSNRICACLTSGNSYAVQVWDSSFQTIFRLPQQDTWRNGVVFASNDLVMSSGGISDKIYWCHISKPKAMKVFIETDVLPFCGDVLKIIIQYLPFITHATHHTLPNTVGSVTQLSSEVVGVQCFDCMFRLYKVNGSEPRLLASLPHKSCKSCNSLATCVYPCSGKESGFMITSSGYLGWSRDVNISVASSQVWII